MLDHPDSGRTTTPRCFAGVSADGRVDLGAGRCGSAAKGDARVHGTLLHELRRMGADNVLDALRAITVDGRYRGALAAGLYVGTGRGARRRLPCRTTRCPCARGSSTSRLRSEWRHWGGCAGSALGNGVAQPSRRGVRVRAHARGGRLPLVLVGEHSVEQSDGQGPRHPHLPHVLSCSSSSGESARILRAVQDAGSDTK